MQLRVRAGVVVRAASLTLLSISMCMLVSTASGAIAAEATETAIKAAYLYKFGFFVEWPSAAFAAADSPINLCVVGKDPFGPMLDEAVKGQKIGERPLEVRRLDAISPTSGCHIAYVPSSADSHLTQVLATLRGSNVLTVTDIENDGGQVGIINFVLKDNRVRFNIDDAAAASVGLSISSRLLNLALDVKSRH